MSWMMFLLSLAAGHYSDRLLVAFRKDVEFNINKVTGVVQLNIMPFDSLARLYKVTRMERWLTSASPEDHDGPVYLSKIYRLYTASKAPIEKIVHDFNNEPHIIRAEVEPIHHLLYEPNDPRYPQEWHLPKIQANSAWDLFIDILADSIPGDTTVVIGVIDTGTDWDHPDLIDNIWQNPGEDADGDGHTIEYQDGTWILDPGDLNGTDDDGNGKIDDLIGWDFGDHDNNPEGLPGPGPNDGHMHGTHVAGISSAVTNNGIGVASTAWSVKIMPVKCYAGGEYIINGYDGILYAARTAYLNGYRCVVNCSWGSYGYSSFEQNVINTAHNTYGAIIVAGAGNEGISTPHYPSAYNNCIGVAATDQSDHKAWFSNYGTWVNLSAPGMSILSTIYPEYGSYAAWDGTSMASPVAASAIALLWSFFIDSSNTWVEDQILNTADNIDDINPTYAGLLGSGRVNVYKAIATTIYPHIVLVSYNLREAIGDGDGVFNPGETGKLRVTLHNEEGWQPAEGLTVRLVVSHPDITVTDSIADFGTLLPGATTTNLGDPFYLEATSDAELGTISAMLILTANESNHPYVDTIEFTLTLTIYQAGWPQSIGSSVKGSPAVTDIDTDSITEIIAPTLNGKLYIWDYEGNPEPGSPVDLSGEIWTAPVVADIDNDGTCEIVVGSRNHHLYIVEPDGSIAGDRDLGHYITGTPTVKDIDNNGPKEIIVGTFGKKLYVLQDGDTIDYPGFPIEVSDRILSGIAVGDINNDGTQEMVFGTYDGNLYAVTSTATVVTGFPVALGGHIWGSPVLADINSDGQLEILIGSDNHNFYIVTADGNILLTIDAGDQIKYEPAVTTVGGSYRILFVAGSKLWCIDPMGNVLDGFPYDAGNTLLPPAVADIDSDDTLDIIVPLKQVPYIDIVNLNTAQLDHRIPVDPVWSPVMLWDIDGDGDLELIFGTNSGVNIIDYKQPASLSNSCWAIYRRNLSRTGNFNDHFTGVETAPIPSFSIVSPTPNPFTDKVSIELMLTHPTTVLLNVYNVIGTKVYSQRMQLDRGTHNIVWGSHNLPPGIYFINLKVGDKVHTYKLVNVK